MLNQFSRTQLLIGEKSMNELANKTVAIFGVGGVGGYTVEALARSGVGHFVLIDDDLVNLTNINRQILASHKTIGRPKVEVAKERILDINPNATVEIHKTFYLPANRDEFDFSKYDYVVDAIDTVTAKIDIIVRCYENNIPVISAMGAGNKMNPTMLEVADIYKTEMDPLAKVMRRELKKRGVKKLKVVYSKEKALTPLEADIEEEDSKRRSIPGSVAFVPSVSGLIIASEVVKDLIHFDVDHRE
jgi:tRNA A37 threonylcarbamoyladenosine dehydratase